MKHNFGIENEKKGRGRPKKEFFEEEYVKQMKKEYDKFLEEKKKKNEVKIDFEICSQTNSESGYIIFFKIGDFNNTKSVIFLLMSLKQA